MCGLLELTQRWVRKPALAVLLGLKGLLLISYLPSRKTFSLSRSNHSFIPVSEKWLLNALQKWLKKAIKIWEIMISL